MDVIERERETTRDAVRSDLAARGFGFALDPFDPRFDQAEISYCKAVLRAKADALFEAYEVYGLAPDDWIRKELNSHQQQLLAARRNSLRQEAVGRAVRTGRNSAPGLARAEALGREIERSTHAFLKALDCEIEKRKHMPKNENESRITNHFHQNVYGNHGMVAQGESITITNVPVNNVLTTIRETIEHSLPSGRETAQLLETLESLKSAKDKSCFLERSSRLLGLATNCVALAPHIATWSDWLRNLVKAQF
jgi:hypothetical protein